MRDHPSASGKQAFEGEAEAMVRLREEGLFAAIPSQAEKAWKL